MWWCLSFLCQVGGSKLSDQQLNVIVERMIHECGGHENGGISEANFLEALEAVKDVGTNLSIRF
jgi:hypothetical protein